MENKIEAETIDYQKIRKQHKNFFIKTQWMMYVLVMLSLAMAVFFYVITIGTKLFIIAILLIMAFMGAIIAHEARKKIAELDDFTLFYGINKLKNEKKV